MKTSLLFLFISVFITKVNAQEKINEKNLLHQPVSVITTTGKDYPQPFCSYVQLSQKESDDCMSTAEMDFYNREAKAAKERFLKRLEIAGQSIPGKQLSNGHVLFDWPMRVSPNYDMQYKYFFKGNFVDQLREDTTVRDYNCGSRTYDKHDASDISLYPFWWRMMDKQYISAVAAAPGIIIKKEDGGFDRECVAHDGSQSNRIFILHSDGTTTRYHHLKKNSLTTKDTGDYVEAGEFLGYVGSSGRSSNPHLHFGVYDENDSIIEPFFNNSNCNDYAEETWWSNQSSYWDSKINRIMTHSAIPSLQFCEDGEKVYAKNNFDPGDYCYVGIAFTEVQANDVASYAIIKPSGDTFSHISVTSLYQDTREYVVNGFTLPPGNAGTWKIRASYKGNIYYHFFTVGCTATLSPGGTQSGARAYIAGNSITSTVVHIANGSDRILYQAQNEIIFKPGFEAPAGIFLRTRLAGCGYAD